MHKNIALPTFLTTLALLVIAVLLEITLSKKDGYDLGIAYGAILILGPILLISGVSGIIHKVQSQNPTATPVASGSGFRWLIIIIVCICGWYALASLN